MKLKLGCEHLEKTKVRFSIFKCSGDMWNSEQTTDKINFCPICGAKCPEKELSLADKFSQCILSDKPLNYFNTHEYFNYLANIARKHYLEKIPKNPYVDNCIASDTYDRTIEDVKRELFDEMV